MAARRHCRLFDDEGAGVTVEFVAIFPAFLLVTFFAFEMIVAMISVGTAEKAAQLGARQAMVSNYVVTTLTSGQTNAAANATTPPGTPCASSGCLAFDSGVVTTCDGSLATSSSNPCSAADFTAVVNRIKSCSTCTGISSLIQGSNIKIQYSYVGLGYAGGPIVPSVTVTIQNVP